MSYNFNATILGNVGNIGEKDLKLAKTAKGQTYTHFSVAVNDPMNRDRQPIWVRVTAWNKQAEACAKYLAKGRKVYITGTPSTSAYVSQQTGEVVAVQQMSAQRVQFLDSKPTGEATAQPGFEAEAEEGYDAEYEEEEVTAKATPAPKKAVVAPKAAAPRRRRPRPEELDDEEVDTSAIPW